MVSAISLCLLALSLTAASSQLLSDESDSAEAPISERRTFKHGKPVKVLPFPKKHKKFAALALPHVFGKGHYEGPIVHEVSRPIYKVHRYHGIEVKPAHDVSFSTPETFIESHSIEPPSGDFAPEHSFPDHSFSSPSFSDHSPYLYDKPSFSSPPPAPIFAPSPPKQIFSFVPAPQPVFQSIPIAPPALVSVPRPAPIQSLPPPVFTSNPLPPAQPIISVIPIKIQTPVLPAPSPAPVFQSVPIKIHHPAPALPVLPGPTPALAAPSPTPIVVKIPTPVLPPVQAPSLPVVAATPAPILPSFPVSLPPPQFHIPAPAPSLPTFPSLPSAPEPEFPYPPSGTPIPSYVKDISLGDTGSTVEPPKFEDVTPVIDDGSKTFDHGFAAIKPDPGFFQKIKGWKTDKANAALSHLTQFVQKPIIQSGLSIPNNPTTHFPGSLPLAQPSIFPIFPPAQFFSPAKYESFPPNNIETPPLVNSYGLPIPHDSYAPPHISHERLSSAASEEEPAVVPAPENKDQNLQLHQELGPSQKFQPQAVPHNEHPVYVAEDKPNDNKTIDDAQPDTNEYKMPKDDVASATHNYPNHKE